MSHKLWNSENQRYEDMNIKVTYKPIGDTPRMPIVELFHLIETFEHHYGLDKFGAIMEMRRSLQVFKNDHDNIQWTK